MAIVIKKIREEKGLSQEEVYNDLNIHIGRIETAKTNVTVSTLASLCKYFKIPLSEFHKMVEDL